MTVSFKAALCAAVIACATPATAATIVQSTSSGNGPAYVKSFDTSIGTLTSVTVESRFISNLYFVYAQEFGDPVISASGLLGLNGLGFYDFTGNYQAVRQDPMLVTIRLDGKASEVTTSDFSSFTGSSSVFLGGLVSNGSFSVNGRELTIARPSFPGQAAGVFTVTYEFTPAIPEPTTWALMLTGFAMTGYALRRRRASVAFA